MINEKSRNNVGSPECFCFLFIYTKIKQFEIAELNRALFNFSITFAIQHFHLFNSDTSFDFVYRLKCLRLEREVS